MSWDANVTSAFLLVREALPDLMATQGAAVVVSSLAGAFAGGWVTVGYTVRVGEESAGEEPTPMPPKT